MARNVFLSCFAVLLFAQAVASESTDATKSTATGNGLQYATAGVQASFTVTAKVSCCLQSDREKTHLACHGLDI